MVTIRARYDGKVLVPEDEVKLPINQPLQLNVVEADDIRDPITGMLTEAERERRKAAFKRFLARRIRVTDIPLEALRRENLYEDRQ